MQRSFSCTERYALVVAVAVSSFWMCGCIESSFRLANESRLPTWITLPPGLTRADVSVTLTFYTLRGNDARFVLRDGRGRKLEVVNGKQLNHTFTGYPYFDAVVANGSTEILEFKRMEPVFYVTDDPVVRKRFLSGSAQNR